MTRTTQSAKEEARESLLEWIKPGDTLYTILRHVSRSGMSRRIGVVKPYIREDTGELDMLFLDYAVATLTENRLSPTGKKGEGICVDGCGMDMGFHLIYSLSYALWPDGFECIGSGCPSNDHSNGDRDYSPHTHRDGGYALKQRWL